MLIWPAVIIILAIMLHYATLVYVRFLWGNCIRNNIVDWGDLNKVFFRSHTPDQFVMHSGSNVYCTVSKLYNGNYTKKKEVICHLMQSVQKVLRCAACV